MAPPWPGPSEASPPVKLTRSVVTLPPALMVRIGSFAADPLKVSVAGPCRPRVSLIVRPWPSEYRHRGASASTELGGAVATADLRAVPLHETGTMAMGAGMGAASAGLARASPSPIVAANAAVVPYIAFFWN